MSLFGKLKTGISKTKATTMRLKEEAKVRHQAWMIKRRDIEDRHKAKIEQEHQAIIAKQEAEAKKHREEAQRINEEAARREAINKAKLDVLKAKERKQIAEHKKITQVVQAIKAKRPKANRKPKTKTRVVFVREVSPSTRRKPKATRRRVRLPKRTVRIPR